MNAAYNFWVPISIGIKEAFNLYSFTIILFFLFFLSKTGRDKKEIFIIGGCFISTAAVTAFLLLLGIFDGLFEYSFFSILVRGFYLIIAVVFLIFGMSHFKEWWRYRIQKKEDPAIKWPLFLTGGEETAVKIVSSSRKRTFFIVICSVILAFMLTLCTSIWPQDYYMFLMFYYWVSKIEMLLPIFSFVWYTTGFILPLLVIWLFILMLASSRKMNIFFRRAVFYVKIIAASVYFSTAISLIYLSFL